MTNFGFLMDLFEVHAKDFVEKGFHKNLVSLWRSGKRRLMPDRHWVLEIAEIFRTADAKRGVPLLGALLRIWYPSETGEQIELLKRFLTEKGQMEPEYQSRRETLLGKLVNEKSDADFSASIGAKAAKLQVLAFLDAVLAQPRPMRLRFVYPQGIGYFLDADFGNKFMCKLGELFQAGHKLFVSITSDFAVGHFVSFWGVWMKYHMCGYIESVYFDDFRRKSTSAFIGIADGLCAIRITELEFGNQETLRTDFHSDEKFMEETSLDIRSYFSRSKSLVYYGLSDNPIGYFENVNVNRDQPFYLLTHIPYFGIRSRESFAELYSLSEEDLRIVSREANPILFGPEYFSSKVPVRHIFSESEIEEALLKSRNLFVQLTKMLGRRIWMQTEELVRELAEIRELLKTNKNYEVCFLDQASFNELPIQFGVWGTTAFIASVSDKPASCSNDYVISSAMQGYYEMVWDEIPEAKRSRAAARHKLDQWLKKAKLYGYNV